MKKSLLRILLFSSMAICAQPNTKVSPEHIVQKQVESFNSGNLDAFVNCYSEAVLVRNFPNDTSFVGKPNMRKSYRRFMDNNPEAKVEVVKRIVIGNKVIDEEIATVGAKIHQQAAIYEIENGLITSMTFIHDNQSAESPEAIVQKQLNAYNSRDIEAFTDTYSENVSVSDFPNDLSFKGKEKMHESYAGFFESTPDLNCEIKNRMVIGNKVIDEEYLTVNGKNFGAVAIYEVLNGKIAKVTFLR